MPRLPDIPAVEDFRGGLPQPARGVTRVQPVEVSDAPVRAASEFQRIALQEAERLSDASADDAMNKLREIALQEARA